MIAVGQLWNQVAEHLGRSWKTVQQQHGGGVFRAGFAIEDVDAIDLYGAVGHVRGGSGCGDGCKGQGQGCGDAGGFHVRFLQKWFGWDGL
jgi:hypothetical protein